MTDLILIDSHGHLEDSQFDLDRSDTIKRAHLAGVKAVIMPGSDMDSSRKISRLLKDAYDSFFLYGAVGIHPHSAKDYDDDGELELAQLLKQDKMVAVGEIGLDYHYDHSPRKIQWDIFERQISFARKRDLPIIVHIRDAHQDAYSLLKSFGEGKGILHCYSGSAQQAGQYLDLGYHISLGGPITFKNARKSLEVAQYIPLDLLCLETDCPYLSPEPYRGKRNEPARVELVAQKIAQLREMPVDDLALITTKNTVGLFGLSELSGVLTNI